MLSCEFVQNQFKAADLTAMELIRFWSITMGANRDL